LLSLFLTFLDRRDARRTQREIAAVLDRIEQSQERIADHTRHIADLVAHSADLVARTAELAARNETLTPAVVLQVTGRAPQSPRICPRQPQGMPVRADLAETTAHVLL